MALSLATASAGFVAPSLVPAAKLSATMSATEFAKTLPGVGPFGFFDPFGFCEDDDMTEGRVRYFREVEVKHGRVAMLAAVGFVVGEGFHPLWGGDIDVPSYVAFQMTPLQTFWPTVVGSIGVLEFFSITTIEGVEVKPTFGDGSPRTPGDFFFDPLGLKPTDPAQLLEMQNKELNNGRLAMIAIAGMVAQELVTDAKLF